MDGGERQEYMFHCPTCGDSFEVNPSMREALIDRGCVFCGGPVTADAFELLCRA